jgi:hypothetical protein
MRAGLSDPREQCGLLTDDLRKADPARWTRAQIALGDAYVAIFLDGRSKARFIEIQKRSASE